MRGVRRQPVSAAPRRLRTLPHPRGNPSDFMLFSPSRVDAAVGTTIADRPPHRTVRARLRIRLSPWMSGDKAIHRVRVQDARYWNPAVQNRADPIPGCPAPLTATD